MILGREDLRVVGIEIERRLTRLLLAKTEETLDSRVTMRPILPLAGGTPFELGGFRGIRQGFARFNQMRNVHPVVHRICRLSHYFLPLSDRSPLSTRSYHTYCQLRRPCDLVASPLMP